MTVNNQGLLVNHLQKTFANGTVAACKDVHLEIEPGELVVLLGPSGCGKTTTLRCIAGLERPDNDDAIWVNGRNMTRVLPKDRHLAFVFQDTALFPHLSVRRNISFGLDMRKTLSKTQIAQRVGESAKMLKVENLLDRNSHELSGGQGQRVALGRAIVMEPDAFLLDEPLANLDAALRVEMRTEIKLIQRKLDTTMIFVTHDQEEALTIGDKVAVMDLGVVQQMDTPKNIYLNPNNLFVATFIGSPPVNQFRCKIIREGETSYLESSLFKLPLPPALAASLSNHSEELILAVRPEYISIEKNAGPFQGTVMLNELMGSRTLIYIKSQGEEVRALVQGNSELKEGESVTLSVSLPQAFYFGTDGVRLVDKLSHPPAR